MVRELWHMKMVSGESVSRHVLHMKEKIEHLGRLGIVFQRELAIDMILFTLPSVYD